jgi:hypothetical protein
MHVINKANKTTEYEKQKVWRSPAGAGRDI